ncbi:MAG: pentapeptide repeat-containing protein [Chloroflexi bacterium]|nr:pentapeptide repeat-containing protein [Ktedonobacteraceae bacterium]MBV9706422.1 pentapeptide repeat-containing protein [Chloroflexota bacterium]
MTETILIGTAIGVLIAVVTSLITLQAQQRAWQRGQASHQKLWQTQQEQRMSNLEEKVTRQFQQIEVEWSALKQREKERADEYIASAVQLCLQQHVASFPYVEEVPLDAPDAPHSNGQSVSWHKPLQLPGVDLSQHDFSHRYLRHADLRKARLTEASLFMTDLSGANLAGADLTGADLSAANLNAADLTGATLVDANLLVADLNDTVLIGANLRKARNLTTEQLCKAIYDSTTSLDEEIDITLPRTPRFSPTNRSNSAFAV